MTKLFVFCACLLCGSTLAAQELPLASVSAAVMDLQTGDVIFDKHASAVFHDYYNNLHYQYHFF